MAKKEMSIQSIRHRLKVLGVDFDNELDKPELKVLLEQHDKIIYVLSETHNHSRLGKLEGNITEPVARYLIEENSVWNSRITEKRKSDR